MLIGSITEWCEKGWWRMSYEVKRFMNHYVLVVNGVEVCHTDTYREAVEEYENNYEWCEVTK